jgi:hypothetical protein
MLPQRYSGLDMLPCIILRDAFKGIFIEPVECVPDCSTIAVRI